MRKSREFDNVLDECLERLLVNGETVTQCLQSFPKHADELQPLLETVLATKGASAIQPRPEFRDRARYQLQSALQEIKPKKSYPIFGWQTRWVTVVATVLVLLLVSSGTVAAASGSMPDNPLYPVKLATEQVQLAFTFSTLGKVELYARLADKRVLEIVRMADENKPEQIELTAQRLDIYLIKITDLVSGKKIKVTITVTPAVKEAPAPRNAAELKEELEIEEAPLLTERAEGGEEEKEEEEEEDEDEEEEEEDKRRAKLKATVASHAANNTARLRALLKTVPASARPALLRAIAVSEAGYEKALKALDKQ